MLGENSPANHSTYQCVYHGWLYFGDEDLKGDESLGCGTDPKLWPRSPITKIQGLVGIPLSMPPCLPATGVPRGSTTESQGMEWMSTGARVSDWDCMLYNLNPLNWRPGHTHTSSIAESVECHLHHGTPQHITTVNTIFICHCRRLLRCPSLPSNTNHCRSHKTPSVLPPPFAVLSSSVTTAAFPVVHCHHQTLPPASATCCCSRQMPSSPPPPFTVFHRGIHQMPSNISTPFEHLHSLQMVAAAVGG
jgi:hypothetical protein